MTLSPFRQREPSGIVLSDRVLETYFNQPAPPTKVSRKALWFLIGCIAFLVLAVAINIRALMVQPASPAHPEKWDSRVAPYAAAVEGLRGQKFLEPVYVDFLTDEAFAADVIADPPEFSAEGTPTVGYYSFADERIRLQGAELTPVMASVLVHELTHALQEQNFGVATHVDLLRNDPTGLEAYHSVLEADARRVEAGWRETLDAKTRTIVTDALAPTARTTLDEFGEAMVRSALRAGGEPAVDALFRLPPTTQEHLLDPWTLVEDRQVALPVDQPHLALSETGTEQGTFGAIGWLALLGERLPATQALTAALGWGGDSYQAFDRGDKACLTVNYTGDTPRDTAEMAVALRAWARTGPSRARVSRVHEVVRLELCGAAAATPGTITGGGDAVQLALAQTRLTAGLLSAGLDTDEARCGGQRLVQTLSIAELETLRAEGAQAQRIVAPCLAD